MPTINGRWDTDLFPGRILKRPGTAQAVADLDPLLRGSNQIVPRGFDPSQSVKPVLTILRRSWYNADVHIGIPGRSRPRVHARRWPAGLCSSRRSRSWDLGRTVRYGVCNSVRGNESAMMIEEARSSCAIPAARMRLILLHAAGGHRQAARRRHARLASCSSAGSTGSTWMAGAARRHGTEPMGE